MNRLFLKDEELPFCKGCTHTTIAESTDRALQKLGKPLLDVILVTDIGCHGIIDKSFNTHTVHGLHGRSVALATGIASAIDHPGKKVIVFIGDGGVSIGVQHIINAAHMNHNMTVVVHNNFLYGMTGGQPSELTPMGFKTPTLPEGSQHTHIDICELATTAGANFVKRVIGIGDISDHLAEAFSKPGFSLMEVMEICPSYGVKANPGMKLSKVVEESGLEIRVFCDHTREPFRSVPRMDTRSLTGSQKLLVPTYRASIDRAWRIQLSGSAGEGVQSAAEFFAMAAMTAGLQVTKKGTYPVTVGTGFSSSEIILSPGRILYTGSPVPDVLVVVSEDGFTFAQAALKRMTSGVVLIDESLTADEKRFSPAPGVRVITGDLRSRMGARNASLVSLIQLLKEVELFPVEALMDQIMDSKLGERFKKEERERRK